MQLKYCAILINLISMSAIAAETLPPILDFKPNCSPTIINQLAVRDVYLTEDFQSQTDQQIELSMFDTSMIKLQRAAKQQHADAIMLMALNKTTITKSSHTSDYKRVIEYQADLVTFCTDDRSLSATPTPYNHLGKKLTVTTFNWQVSETAEESLASLAKAVKKPQADVSFTHVYGIPMSASSQVLFSTLGPASVQLSLEKNQSAWLYGRNLWFILINDKVEFASSTTALLSAYGKNWISFNDNFDDNPWTLFGKINIRDELADVLTQSDHKAVKISSHQYAIKHQNNTLIMDFADYKPNATKPVNTELTQFTLHSNHFTQPIAQIQFSPIDTQGFSSVVSGKNATLADRSAARYINNNQQNSFNLTQDKQWFMLSSFILVKQADEVITRVKLTSALTTEKYTQGTFAQAAVALNLPQTKSEFMAHYPDAEDNYDSVNIDADNYTIEAIFESEQDNALLVEFEISYLD
jgi:pterin-4a-carbinolamine dehydratase